MDIDRLIYCDGEPICFIEDRRHGGRPYDKNQSNIKAFARLARRNGIAGFFHDYAPDFSWHVIRPMDKMSAQMFPPAKEFGVRMSDTEYCVWEHQIRGFTIDVNEANEIMEHYRRLKVDQPENRHVHLPIENPSQLKKAVEEMSEADQRALAEAVAHFIRPKDRFQAIREYYGDIARDRAVAPLLRPEWTPILAVCGLTVLPPPEAMHMAIFADKIGCEVNQIKVMMQFFETEGLASGAA
jgi:hypothetical protein